ARVGPLELAVALGVALAALAGTIGADARWLAALGRIIVHRGGIPDGIPYASAPSSGWHNVPVLAELILRGLTSAAGDRGLLAAWPNLHGAGLVGLAVAAAYLIFERGRRQPLLAAAAFLVSAVALCATPALQHTPDYYAGLVRNEAARRGEGLWAPLSFTSG